MSDTGLKLVKHEINRNLINKTKWLNEDNFITNTKFKETSFTVGVSKKIANQRLIEQKRILKFIDKKNQLLIKINRLLKIIGISWIICLASIIAFTIVGYLTPKQTTGYKCLGCPSGLYYNSKTGTCVYFINCTLSQYWNGSMCADSLTYNNQTCSNSSQCLRPMICNLSTNESTCNCPSSNTLNKCDCPVRVSGNEYFSNGSTCVSAISIGNTCFGNYTCQYLTQNTYCNGVCQCAALQYFNLNQLYCINQLTVNQSCILTTDCRIDLGLSCSSGLCQCNSTTFWNGSSCVPPYTYNSQTCTSSSQCKSPLICNLAGTSCNCPNAVPINKCDCPRSYGNEYYWSGSTCVLASSYGQVCSVASSYTCQYLTQNTICNAGVCSCSSNGLWNSSTCLYCPTNWLLFYNSCVIGSSAAVLYTSLTPSIISTYCFNVANTRLGRLHTNADQFATQFTNSIAFPQSYYYFDAHYAAGGTYYMSSDGLYTFTWDTYYWIGPNSPSYNCSLFENYGYWFYTYPCNYIEYFICELQLL